QQMHRSREVDRRILVGDFPDRGLGGLLGGQGEREGQRQDEGGGVGRQFHGGRWAGMRERSRLVDRDASDSGTVRTLSAGRSRGAAERSDRVRREETTS